MEDNLLLETTLFKDDGEKEAILNDPTLIRTLFWINNLGLLALKKEYSNHYLVIKSLKNLKSARIANINDDDNDMAVTLKMAFDKGYLRLSFVNEYTKLLFLLKSKPNLDINEDILRDLFNKINWATMLPDPRIRPVIKSWLDGEIKLAELIRPFYQFAKLHKHSDGFQLIARMTGAFSTDFSDDDAQVDSLIDKKPDVVVAPVAPVAPTTIPIDKGVPLPTSNFSVTPTPTPVIHTRPPTSVAPVSVPVSAPVVDNVEDKKEEEKPEPTAAAIVATVEEPKVNITTVKVTEPIVAPAAEVTTIDPAGEPVVKKRGRPKKTAADVTVTNKVAIVDYDDDRYKQIIEDTTYIVSVASDKFLDPNSYSDDADRFNLYVLIASVYAKDLDKYYTTIYGDKRTAKKNIIRTYRDVASFIRTYGTVNNNLVLDNKIGFGEIKLSPVGINMPQDTFNRLYQHKIYQLPRTSDKLSEKMSEERFDSILESGITPSIKEVFDALSSTADYMFTEGEYKKAIDTYNSALGAEYVVWFSPYEYSRLSDFSRFSKSYGRYTNYHRLIDMYIRGNYDDDTYDKAIHLFDLVYKNYPDILVTQQGILRQFNGNIVQMFNHVKLIKHDDMVDFIELLERMSKDESFVDTLSNLLNSSYNLSSYEFFEKYSTDSDLGKRFLAITSTGFFTKLRISLHLPEIKTGSAAVATLVTKVGDLMAFGGGTKYDDYSSSGNYIEDINSIIDPENDPDDLFMIDDKKLASFITENGGNVDDFMKQAIDYAVQKSQHKRWIKLEKISELPYIMVEYILADVIEREQFNLLPVSGGGHISQEIVKRYLDEHRREITEILKNKPFGSIKNWNDKMVEARYSYSAPAPLYAHWEALLSDKNIVNFFGPSKITDSYNDFTLLNMMSLNNETTNSFIQMVHNGDIPFMYVNAILKERFINSLELLIKVNKQDDVDRFFRIAHELLSATTLPTDAIKAVFGKILQLQQKPHNIQLAVAKLFTDIQDIVEPNSRKIYSALVMMVIDPHFSGNEEISLDVLTVNPEQTLNVLVNNQYAILDVADVFPDHRGSIGDQGVQKFFGMYSKLGQMISISKKWNDYIANVIILQFMSKVQYFNSNANINAVIRAGLEGYKTYMDSSYVQSMIASYVEYIVTSRRKSARDKVSEALIRYNRDWYKIYATMIRDKMKDSKVNITPTVAKNMGFGTLFNDIYNDSDLSETQRREEFDEYLKLVFGEDKITPKHIESITDDMVTNKAVMDMLNNTKQVLPLYLKLTPKGLSDILKFNDFDVKTHAGVKFTAAEFKSKGIFDSIKDTIEKVDIVGVPDLQVTKLDLSTDDLDAISYDLYEKKYNGRHGDIACIVLDVYDVHIRPDELVAFKAANPNAKVETQLFHGTGSVAANMILRFGFKVVTQNIGGVQVTGKMLGNGIYLSPVLEKSLQYVGDSGFGRKFGTIGYVFESNLYSTGDYGQIKRAGYGGDNIRSPELVVYNGRAQIEIYKCYKVKLVSKSVLKARKINRSI